MTRMQQIGLGLVLGGMLAAGAATAQTAAPVVDRVRIHPAPGQAEAMVGGRIAGSNLGQTLGFEELASIERTPAEGEWLELRFENAVPYRFVKYEGPDGSHGTIAEVAFYAGERKLEGAGFGVAGSRADGGPWADALDGDPATWFEARLANGAYVGLDLGTDANTTADPTLQPDPGRFDQPPRVRFDVPDGATVRYTTDGSTPTRQHGAVYDQPFTVGPGVVHVRAVAYRPDQFASGLAAGTYLVGPDAKQQRVVSYHVGNSLSDTFINGALEAVASSAGYDPLVGKFSIPGAPTDWLWNHQGTGFGVWVGEAENRVNTNLPTEALPLMAPIDFMTTQPFAGHGRSIPNEAEHSGKFYELARESSPNVRFYLYQQWPGRGFDDRWAQGRGDDLADLNLTPAETWEQAVDNHTAYFEKLRRVMDEQQPGKPIRIIPTGIALKNLKAALEAGRIPGLPRDQFFELHFGAGDQGPGWNIHMIEKGRYFVALVVYCTAYGEAPDQVDLPQEYTTLTREQDAMYKRIAWQTVRDYQWSGVE